MISIAWKPTVKSCVARALSVLTNRLSPGGPVIFMFHRILPDRYACHEEGMVTSTAMFDGLLEWLKENYETVLLRDLVQKWTSLSDRRKSVCSITLDDGWRDNFTYALPLLLKHGMRATIFLPVAYVGTDRQFWTARFATCIASCRSDGRINELLRRARMTFRWWPEFVRERSQILDVLLKGSTLHAESFVSLMENELACPLQPSERTFMNWDEVKEMHRAGVEFGSHTVNHHILPLMDIENARREIVVSLEEIRDRLDSKVAGFSYPWGIYTREIRNVVAASGYNYAVTTTPHLTHRLRDQWLIPRIGISDLSLGCGGQAFVPQVLALQLARGRLRGYSSLFL